jgi:nucleoside-diphosphate-sugar epimerase
MTEHNEAERSASSEHPETEPSDPGSETPRKVLVTGGAGVHRKPCGRRLPRARRGSLGGRRPLERETRERPGGATFVEMGIEDPDLGELFTEVGFDLVNHHAAQIDVRVSVRIRRVTPGST